MGYTLHINGATVVADQLDEIKVLIEALRPAAPKPRARTAPDPLLDEPEEEPRFAPMYPSWDMAPAPTVGEGRNETGARTVDWAAPLEAGPKAIPAPAPAPPAPAPAKAARSIRVKAALEVYWAKKRAARAAAPAPLQKPPAPAPPAGRRIPRRPIGRGSVQKRGTDRFVVILSNGKTTKFGGAFPSLEAANVAREEIYQARLRGDPIPVFGSARPCGRCRAPGHRRRDCAAPEIARTKPAPDPAKRANAAKAFWDRRRAADPIGFKYRAKTRKHQDVWALQLVIDGRYRWGGRFDTEAAAAAARDAWLAAARAGEPLPEFRKRAHRCGHCRSFEHGTKTCPVPRSQEQPPKKSRSDSMKAAWETRRARAIAEGAPSRTRRPLAKAIAAAYTETGTSVQVARAPAQLPPRCIRCFKVGHVEAQCPRHPYIEELGIMSIPPADTWLRPPADATNLTTCSDRQTDPSCLTAGAPSNEQAKQEQEPPYDGALLDDGGTDLTDLVDVPDAEPPPTTELVGGHRGWQCNACGRKGHGSGSPDCPLSSPATPTLVTPPAGRPYTAEGWASWRASNPEPSARVFKTLPPKPMTRIERTELVDYPEGVERPKTRGDCEGAERPCPWASCKYHLAIDVHPGGSLQINRADVPIEEMTETCALDVADRGATLEEIGQAIGTSRERVRQIETLGLVKIRAYVKRHKIDFELPAARGSNAPEDAT